MKLFKAMATVGGFTLLSRIAGFIRDILTAALLGAGPIADAFFVALKLPNFFRRITAEGAFSVSFVPMFSSEKETNGEKEALSFADESFAIMVALLIPFVVTMVILMPWLVYIIAPGFSGETVRYDLAVELSRITFPYILMMSLAALIGGVLNSYGRFAPFAAAPVFFNFCLILSMIFLTPHVATVGHALAYGVFFAGITQFLFMFYCLRKTGLKIKFKRPVFTERIKQLFKRMAPGVVSAGVVQINLFIDLILASLLPAGAISYLYYADRLYQLPLSVIGIAIGTALLPMLSKALAGKKTREAEKLFSHSIELGLTLSLPAAVALIIIPEPIMGVLFHRGAFDAVATLSSANALMAYALGLPAFVMVKIYSTALFAEKDTKTPVKFAIIGAITNTILGLLFIIPLQHVGIALATTIAAWLNCFLISRKVKQKGSFIISTDSKKRLFRIMISAVLMGGIIYGIEYLLHDSFYQAGLNSVTSLILLVFGGGISYIALLHLTGGFKLHQLKTFFVKS